MSGDPVELKTCPRLMVDALSETREDTIVVILPDGLGIETGEEYFVRLIPAWEKNEESHVA